MRTKAEQLGLIDETIAYYGSDPIGRRGVEPGDNMCVYNSEKGQKCAVGRCFNDLGVQEFGQFVGGYKTLLEEIGHTTRTDVNEYFKPQYRGFEEWIWSNLQVLHDAHKFWADSGLTEAGEAFVKDFKALVEEGIRKELRMYDYLP